MRAPLVSIIIPVYNGSNYMREAIDSALAQTYKNIEVIVVNDGSTDSTEEIAKSYGDKIRYFFKENGGVSSALNLAIKNANGEYISWLSHDDVYYPEKIEKQIEFLSGLNDRNVILFSDYEFMNDRSEVIGSMVLDHVMLEKKPEYALLRGCINGITLLIPKKAFDEYGEFDEKLRCTQDYEMWHLMMKSYKFVHMPVILAKYRMHPEQDTNKSPNVIFEGDALWVKIVEETPDTVKIRLEGSKLQFYSEMVLFLKDTPYKKAFEFSYKQREAILEKYSFSKRIFLMALVIVRSDILRNKLRFALCSPRRFFKKHFKKTIWKIGFVLRKNIKKAVLCLNDKTIRTRFYFDGEYERWFRFNALKTHHVNIASEKGRVKNIYFLVPGTEISGGIAVIFKYANMLLEKGFDVKILSLNNKNSEDWFPGQRVEIIPYSEIRAVLNSGTIDVLIATGYSTAFTVDMARARRKLYFIQSDESRFFPYDKQLTERIKKTYELPLEGIVAVSWLKEWLKKEFGKDAYLVPNGLDLNIFHKTDPIEKKISKVRVLIEGAINVPYKGMDDAYAVVKGLDCELWIVSNNGRPRKEWVYDRFFENVPFNEMPKIYSSCDILLKMSRVESFCYPPLEMMACGGASVIRRVTGIEEYAVDKENCLIVNDIAQAREVVKKLIDDEILRKQLVENGYKTAQGWGWDRSVNLLEKVITRV